MLQVEAGTRGKQQNENPYIEDDLPTRYVR